MGLRSINRELWRLNPDTFHPHYHRFMVIDRELSIARALARAWARVRFGIFQRFRGDLNNIIHHMP